MANPLKQLLFNLARAFFQRALEKRGQEQNFTAEEKKIVKEYKKREQIAKINYYNYISIFYFEKIHKFKKFIIISLVLDLLLFYIPKELLLSFSENFYLNLKLGTEYFLILITFPTLFISNPYYATYILRSKAKLFLSLIVLFILGIGIYDFLMGNSDANLVEKLLQIGVVLIAVAPIIHFMRDINKQQELPQLDNLIRIALFLIFLILIRINCLLHTISSIASNEKLYLIILFIFASLILMLHSKPLNYRRNAITW